MECNVASIVSESNYGVLVHKIVFLGNIGEYFGFDLTLQGKPCSFFYNMLQVIVDFRCMKIGLWNYRPNCMSKCSNHPEILISSLLFCYYMYNAIGYADHVLFQQGSSKGNIVQYYRNTCNLVHEDILNQVAYNCFGQLQVQLLFQ